MRLAVAAAFDAYGIKAAIGQHGIMFLQIGAGGIAPFALLGRRDGFGGGNEAAALPQAYLHEDDGFSRLADKIQFTAADAHVAGKDAQAVLLQVAGGKRFAFAAADEVEDVFHGAGGRDDGGILRQRGIFARWMNELYDFIKRHEMVVFTIKKRLLR